MKSAAVVNFAPEKGSVEIREIEKPTIGAEDVLLEVANVGVCGSDLHQWTSDHSWPVNYPVVLGHEFGGHIIEVGKEVEGWKEGDRVVSETAAIISKDNPMTRRGAGRSASRARRSAAWRRRTSSPSGSRSPRRAGAASSG